jgi:AraC family transcriptional activator of pobA
MAKQVLPVYDICNLTGNPHMPGEIMVDRFTHYLETHRDLHFPHKHSFYHLVYFTGGVGKHSIDFVPFAVKPGQIYFMVPGQVHSWNFTGDPEGYIVNFSERFIQSLVTDPRYLERFSFFSGIASEQLINLPKKERENIVDLFEKLLQEQTPGKENAEDMMRALLIQLFIEVGRCQAPRHKEQSAQYNSVLLHTFKKLVDIHYKEKKLTKDYASLLYVTPNHLNALCKDLTGHPAGEIIRNRVILEAKRLLVNAGLTIAEIAAELDFADNSYFSKFFKKYEGVTPEVFRRKVHEGGR